MTIRFSDTIDTLYGRHNSSIIVETESLTTESTELLKEMLLSLNFVLNFVLSFDLISNF